MDTLVCQLSVSSTNDTIQYWYTQKFLLLTAFYNEYNPWFGLSIESKKKLVYVTKIEFFDKKLEIETINKSIFC
jgi:hypothetical protein